MRMSHAGGAVAFPRRRSSLTRPPSPGLQSCWLHMVPSPRPDIMSVRQIDPITSVCLWGSFRFCDEMVVLRHALQARRVLCE